MWVDILIWWIIFSVAYTIGYGIYCLFRPLFRRNKQKPKPQPNRAVHIQQAPPTIHIQQTRPTVISTQHISTHVSHSSTSDYKPPIITPPPATEPKEPIVTPPPTPTEHTKYRLDQLIRWVQDGDLWHCEFCPPDTNVNYLSCEVSPSFDPSTLVAANGKIGIEFKGYAFNQGVYGFGRFNEQLISPYRGVLSSELKFTYFNSYKILPGGRIASINTNADAIANCIARQEQEAEERRQKALEEEKAEIAAKIKAKHRKQQLEKIVRQELIDSGELFGEQAKRPRIPREVVDAVYSRDGGRCVYCGSTDNLQLDHIIPFSRGGATNVENLQLLCQKCNLEKSNKIG